MFISLVLIACCCAQTPAIDSSKYAALGYPGFGTIVGKAGDVDRDGTPDFICGDRGIENDDPTTRLWIVSGKTGDVLQRIALPWSDGGLVPLDGGVDVDRDGVPDLLIAIVSKSSRAAHLHVVSGKSGERIASIDIDGPSWLGAGAHFVGDFDGDGIADIGCLSAKPDTHVVELTIYSTAKKTPITSFHVDNICDYGNTTGAFADMGDLDGDGAHEVAICLTCGAFGNRSVVRVCSGKTRAVLWEHRPACTSSGDVALALLDSIDRERAPHIAVGVYGAVDVLQAKTGERLFHLPLTEKTKDGEPNMNWYFGKEESAADYGCSLVALGDIDGDGITDLAIGDPQPFAGRVVAVSGASGKELWSSSDINGDELWHLGRQVVAIGDVDHDGIVDLVTGTNGYESQSKGYVHVISGRDGSLLMQLKRWSNDVRVTRRKAAAQSRSVEQK